VVVEMTSGKTAAETHRILGEVDYTSAFTTLHEKAIYLHQGQQYYVHALDIAERRAYVKRVDSDYYTDAITYTKVKTLEAFESAAEHNHGEVHVAHQVVGFKKIKFFTMENVGSGDLNLPVQEMHTTGVLDHNSARTVRVVALHIHRSTEWVAWPGVRAGAAFGCLSHVRSKRLGLRCRVRRGV
jgi:ATP-dependent helicase YprA (DUF1998 family)